MQVLQSRRQLLDDLEYLRLFKDDATTVGARVTASATIVVQQVKDAASRDVLGDHVVVAVLVKRDAHVEDDVRMAYLVYYLYLFDEVGDALLLYTLSSKSLHGDDIAHPDCLEYFTVAATTEEIGLVVQLEVTDVDVEAEAIIIEGVEEVLVGVAIEVAEVIFVVAIYLPAPTHRVDHLLLCIDSRSILQAIGLAVRWTGSTCLGGLISWVVQLLCSARARSRTFDYLEV